MTAVSAFAKFENKAWPHTFRGAIEVDILCGGTPSDPKVSTGHIKSKLGSPEELIQAQVAETMVERGVPMDEAAKIVSDLRNLNGFKRDELGLYIEGRQLKAALREAASIAVSSGKVTGGKAWGITHKGLQSFFRETVMIEEDRLHLGIHEVSGVAQRFIKKTGPSGPVTAILLEEYVENVRFEFTAKSAWDFTDEQWAMFWLIGQEQGLGASRSQGFGRYVVTEWKKI